MFKLKLIMYSESGIVFIDKQLIITFLTLEVIKSNQRFIFLMRVIVILKQMLQLFMISSSSKNSLL
jgi:hypothetical protein